MSIETVSASSCNMIAISSRFHVRILKEPLAGYDQCNALPLKYVEKYASISVWYDDEEESTEEDLVAVEKEIETLFTSLPSPRYWSWRHPFTTLREKNLPL
jgi:hypothetical protein